MYVIEMSSYIPEPGIWPTKLDERRIVGRYTTKLEAESFLNYCKQHAEEMGCDGWIDYRIREEK